MNEQLIREFLQSNSIEIAPERLRLEPTAKEYDEAERLNQTALQLIAEGRLREAADLEMRSIAILPAWVEPYHNLGFIFYRLGNKSRAASFFKLCILLNPFFDPAYDNLAKILLELDEPLEALRVSLELESYALGSSDNRLRIGTIYLRRGMYDEAREWLDKGFNSPLSPQSTQMLPYGVVSIPRLQHDIAQLSYLIGRGILPPIYRHVTGAYRRALESSPYGASPESWATEQEWKLSLSQLSQLSPFYRRVLHLARADAVSPCALNPKIKFRQIEDEYFSQQGPYNLVVIDDFLTEEALEALRRYCLESTVWHYDGQKGRNYLGAHQGGGFSIPLMAQIAAEVRETMPDLIGTNELTQLWAYQHVTGKTGIGAHADYAEINVNFWLTPDSANLNSDSGGMIVYKKVAPPEWAFDDYNGNIERVGDEIKDAERIVIPYRQNRAVIFNSGMFHESDEVSFNTAYEDSRINITLLYGDRSGRRL